MSKSNFIRRFSMGLGILIIIAFIVCVYFYFYVGRQEEKMNTRNFRVLQQTGKKLENRIKDYSQLANTEFNAKTEGRKDYNYLFRFDTLHRLTAKNIPEWRIENSRIYFYFTRHKDTLSLSMDFNRILLPLLRYDVFDAYTLHENKTILCNSLDGLCQFPKTDSFYNNDGCRELAIGKDKHRQFFHPFTLENGNTLLLSGFMTSEHYTHTKYVVPGSFLLNVLIILFLILLGFPFIKSLLMAPEETLGNRDILISVLSLFLFCYLYVFFHVQVYTSWAFDSKTSDQTLDSSSNHIKKSFVNELNQAYKLLTVLDSAHSADISLQRDIYDTKVSLKGIDSIYRDCKRVYWIDKTGAPVHEWAFDGEVSQVTDYSKRSYFNAAKHRDLWFLNGDTRKQFYLEPIFSWNDGSFRAAISKPSENSAQIAAITSNMVSVINTIQAQDINYCIIDKHGKTLFNSLGNNHISEDFIEECDNPTVMKSAMHARSSIPLEVNYLGSSYRMRLSPIEGLPLFIATFADRSAADNSQLHLFIFTTLFILVILIGFALTIIISILIRKRPKDRMTPFWDISWLYPRKKYELHDLAGICSNVVVLTGLILASLALRNYPLSLFTLYICTAIGTTATFCYARLELKKNHKKLFGWILGLIFLFADLFVAYVDAYKELYVIGILMTYQTLLMLILYYVKKPPQHMVDLQKHIFSPIKNKRRFDFYHQYALLLVTWFVIIVAVPCYNLYYTFHKEERESLVKASQFGLAEQLYSKVNYTGEKKNPPFYIREPLNGLSGINDYTNIYTRDYLNTNIGFANHSGLVNTETSEQQILGKILSMARMSLKTKTGLGTILSNEKKEGVNFYLKQNKMTLAYQNIEHQKARVPIGNTLTVQSTIPELSRPGLTDKNGLNPIFILYILSPFIFLLLFYWVILYFIKRYFLFDFFPENKPLEGALKTYIEQLEDKDGDGLKLFIVGLSSSGKNKIINDAVAGLEQAGKLNVHRIDMASLEITTSAPTQDNTAVQEKQVSLKNKVGEQIKENEFSKKDIFIFRHFEHDLADEKTTAYKFELIADLFLKTTRPNIIILSTVHPSVFLNNLKAKVIKKPEIEDTFRAEDYINQQEYYNWTGLLSGFTIHVQPLKPETDVDPAKEFNKIYYAQYREKYLHYLARWNALERLEKFVLYDLAKDHLANCRNELALYSLHSKGIINNADMPDITDKNFRNFIICEIRESEVEAERIQSKSSAWSKFKTPFLIIISAVLFIIFITQQESFNKIAALIGVFGTSLSVLIRLFPINQNK